jgi:hypothetical protein
LWVLFLAFSLLPRLSLPSLRPLISLPQWLEERLPSLLQQAKRRISVNDDGEQRKGGVPWENRPLPLPVIQHASQPGSWVKPGQTKTIKETYRLRIIRNVARLH